MAIEVLKSDGLSVFSLNKDGFIQEKEILKSGWNQEQLFFDGEHKTIWGIEEKYSQQTIACYRLNQNKVPSPRKFVISKFLPDNREVEPLFAKVLDNGDLMLFCKADVYNSVEGRFYNVIFQSTDAGLVTGASIPPSEINELDTSDAIIQWNYHHGNLVLTYEKQIKFEEDDEEWDSFYKRIVCDGNGKMEFKDIDKHGIEELKKQKDDPIEFDFEPVGTATFTRNYDVRRKFLEVVKCELTWDLNTDQTLHNQSRNIFNVIETPEPSLSSESIVSRKHPDSLENRISNLEAAIGDILAMLDNMNHSS